VQIGNRRGCDNWDRFFEEGKLKNRFGKSENVDFEEWQIKSRLFERETE
jgi:hypothetical protein